MKNASHLIAVTVALLFTACDPADPISAQRSTLEAAGTPVLGDWGVALENIDETVKPGDDFFRYVNGKWLDKTEIPADKSSHNAFSILADLSDERVKVIIENSAAAEAEHGTEDQKIGDFYSAFTNVEVINTAGLDPIKEDLASIAGAETHRDIARLMSSPSLGTTSPVTAWVGIDERDAENFILWFFQSGLGMPVRDYYLDQSEESAALRVKYIDYLTEMLTASGTIDPTKKAHKILAFETSMASVHWPPEDVRDLVKTYNKISLVDLKVFADGFPWDVILDTIGLSDQTTFVLGENTAIQALAELFQRTDVGTLKDYLTAHYVGSNASYLPQSIDEAHFAFYGTALRGTEHQRERWKRAVGQIELYMGEMVGKVYVREHYRQRWRPGHWPDCDRSSRHLTLPIRAEE